MIPRIVGHRGAAGLFPENSLEGFRKAAELGLKCVELDVHTSIDGVPVVVHDEARVKGFTASEAVRAGIPLLSDVLNLLDRLKVMSIVEIKSYSPGMLECVDGYDVILSSFNAGYLSHITTVPVLLNSWHTLACPSWAQGVVYHHPHAVRLTKLSGAFTVNDKETAIGLFDQGIDFIITDRPDLLCSL